MVAGPTGDCQRPWEGRPGTPAVVSAWGREGTEAEGRAVGPRPGSLCPPRGAPCAPVLTLSLVLGACLLGLPLCPMGTGHSAPATWMGVSPCPQAIRCPCLGRDFRAQGLPVETRSRVPPGPGWSQAGVGPCANRLPLGFS